jgi:hypothetical protein
VKQKKVQRRSKKRGTYGMKIQAVRGPRRTVKRGRWDFGEVSRAAWKRNEGNGAKVDPCQAPPEAFPSRVVF